MDGYVEIQEHYYNCIVKEGFCTVFNYINDDDVDYIGRFKVQGNKIYEFYPMSNVLKEVGTIHWIQ